jgi:hypothetical protein
VDWFLLYVAVGILSTARTARLVVFDDYPPMVWLRDRWDTWTKYDPHEVGWGKLLHCAFCATPYIGAVVLAWALLALPGSDWKDWWSSAFWWVLLNGLWGAVYLAAMAVAYDQPEG